MGNYSSFSWQPGTRITRIEQEADILQSVCRRLLVKLAKRASLATLSPCRLSRYRLILSAAPTSPCAPSPPLLFPPSALSMPAPRPRLLFPPRTRLESHSVRGGAMVAVGEDSNLSFLTRDDASPPLPPVRCAERGDATLDAWKRRKVAVVLLLLLRPPPVPGRERKRGGTGLSVLISPSV